MTVCQGAAAAEDVEESLAVHFPPIEDHVVLEQRGTQRVPIRG